LFRLIAISDPPSTNYKGGPLFRGKTSSSHKIAVGGESAGANLAAVVAQLWHNFGLPALLHQMLVNPMLDYSDDSEKYPSRAEFASGYGLMEAASWNWFKSLYLRNEADTLDPRASPIAEDHLANLAPALIITSEFDLLRDEGVSYANRLNEAGTFAKHVNFEGMIHGFFAMAPLLNEAVEAQALACNTLVDAMSGGTRE